MRREDLALLYTNQGRYEEADGRPSNRLFAANGVSLVQTRFEPRSFVAACQARGIGALRSAVGGGQSGARDRPI